MADTTADFTDAQLQKLFDTATQQAARSAGTGLYGNLYSTILSKFDRFGINHLMPNNESVGFTFITRPKLNFSTTSLRQDRILSMLDTTEPNSLQFAIRCYLDTKFSRRSDIQQIIYACPFFNPETPFIIPLSNNLISLGGWPDPVIDTETTDGGFFSEDMTIAKGSDRLNRTYNLTLSFRDIQGGFIIALLYFWHRYIELVLRGDVIAYPEDISARRVNYTCSIYRFVLDPSRRYITKWSKATGCFPHSPPIGNIFNFGERENFIHSAAQYSVPFIANKIEILDPIIFRDFNTITKRYATSLTNTANLVYAPSNPEYNFIGTPFVDVIEGYNHLKFVVPDASYLQNPLADTWSQLKEQLQSVPDVPPQTSFLQQSSPNFEDSSVLL